MENLKENAIQEYKKIIRQSWTYLRMTQDEQERLDELLDSVRTYDAVKGSYKTRWAIIGGIYNAFLVGLGYDGPYWRETEFRTSDGPERGVA